MLCLNACSAHAAPLAQWLFAQRQNLARDSIMNAARPNQRAVVLHGICAYMAHICARYIDKLLANS